MYVRIQEYLKLRNFSCISHAPIFFSCANAPIFKFYSVEVIDDVYGILLYFMDFYLQKNKSWEDRWRLFYILAISWEV